MDFKYYLKEFLWITGLYGVSRETYRKLKPEIVKSESQEINFYQNNIQSGDLVFDVGAHLGDKTAAFLALNAEVVAIEPDRRFIKHIEKRFSNKAKIHLVNKGISPKPETLLFYRRKTASTSGVVQDWCKGVDDAATVYEIQTTTLDLLIEQFGLPKYIKIDVEGFEIEVLRGLSRSIPLVSFEFHYQQLSRAMECINLLSKSGEKYFNVTPTDESKFIFDKWQTRHEFETFIKQSWKIDELGTRGDIYVKSAD